MPLSELTATAMCKLLVAKAAILCTAAAAGTSCLLQHHMVVSCVQRHWRMALCKRMLRACHRQFLVLNTDHWEVLQFEPVADACVQRWLEVGNGSSAPTAAQRCLHPHQTKFKVAYGASGCRHLAWQQQQPGC